MRVRHQHRAFVAVVSVLCDRVTRGWEGTSGTDCGWLTHSPLPSPHSTLHTLIALRRPCRYVAMFGLTHELSPALWPTCPDAPAFLRCGDGHSAVALLELAPGQSAIENHNGAHFAMRVQADQFTSARDGGLEALARTSATHAGQSTAVEYCDYGPQKSLVSKGGAVAGGVEAPGWGGVRRVVREETTTPHPPPTSTRQFVTDPDNNIVELTTWGITR